MKRTFRLCMTALLLLVGTSVWAINKVNGSYQISSVQDLKEFAELVAGDEPKANAVLTADLDLGSEQIHIGDLYGKFDGQEHTITVQYSATSDEDGALFNTVHVGAEVCNLITTGKITTSHKFAAGFARTSWGYIHNCASFVEIDSQFNGDATHGGIVAVVKSGAIVNCLSCVKIKGSTTENCGGIAGWLDGRTYLRNNLSLTEMNINVNANCGSIARNPGNLQNNIENKGYYQQNFYLNAYGNTEVGKKVTDEQLKSGAVCYQLNAGVAHSQWTQKNGDNYPMPFPNYGMTIGATQDGTCMGAINEGATYTLGGGIASDQHEMFHGRCKHCGYLPLEDMKFGLSGAGILLSDAEDVMQYSWYRYLCGDEVNATMVQDIDMGNAPYFTNPDNWCSGVFDGAGHTLNINLVGCELNEANSSLFDEEWLQTTEKNKNNFRAQPFSTGTNCLFGNLSGNGQVHDLNVTGNIYSNGRPDKFAATITNKVRDYIGSQPCIYNVYSEVEIESTLSDDNTVAGLVGVVESNCLMENVVFAGKIVNTTSNDKCYGGLIGWASTPVQLRNALMIGKMEVGGGESDNHIISRNYGNVSPTNVYYLPVSATVSYAGNYLQADNDELESGKLAWELNKHSFANPTWYQNLDAGDECPSFSPSRGYVYCVGEEYYSATDPETESAAARIIEYEMTALETVIANKALVSAFNSQLEALADYQTMKELGAAYEALDRNLLQENIEAYKAYKEAIDYIADQLQNEYSTIEGEDVTALKTYLSTAENDVYKKGELNTEDMKKETVKVYDMFKKAIIGNYGAGSDITLLLTNADFSHDTEGWTIDDDKTPSVSHVTNINSDVCHGVEFKENTFNMSQTITGLKPGVYEFSINGAFRPSDNIYSYNHAAYIYVNGTRNYLMTSGEDMLTNGDEVNGLNAYIKEFTTDKKYSGNYDYCYFEEPQANVEASNSVFNDALGSVPSSSVGMALAAQAGRYINKVIGIVGEDGELTIGVCNPGTMAGTDVTLLANARLKYLGTAEEANITEAYVSMKDRAISVLENYNRDLTDFIETPGIPNFSEEMKTALENAAANKASIENAKTLSQFFIDVYDCKQAYRQVYLIGNVLADVAYVDVNNIPDGVEPLFSEEDMDAFGAKSNELVDAYYNGSLSLAEAQNVITELQTMGMPKQDEDGVFQTSTAKNMVFMAAYVQQVGKADIAMTNDIDMSGVNFAGFGQDDSEHRVRYEGTFDGQDHKLTNIYVSHEDKQSTGFFNFVGNATIKNVEVDASCEFNGGRYTGFIGSTNGNYTVTMDRVATSATVISNAQNGGGLIGCCIGDCKVLITNCFVGGSVTSDFEGGAISGWLGTNSESYVRNSLSVATVVNGDNFCRKGGSVSTDNNYSLTGGAGATQVTAEKLASGEITYLLNGSSSEEPVWFQTIGTDANPSLFGTTDIVFADNGQYYNGSDAAETVMDLIDAIGTVELTAECKDLIDAAREAYDALTETDQAKVENYQTLVDAETEYARLEAIANVVDAIDAIGTVELTTECKGLIDAARAAYDELSEDDQAEVENYQTLVDAETEYARLKAIDDVEKAIKAIGTVELTEDSKALIDAAREAYDELSEDDQEEVENYQTLVDAEAEYARLEAIDDVEKAIDAIGVVEPTDECKALIDAAREAYDALSEDDQAEVENYQTLLNAEEAYLDFFMRYGQLELGAFDGNSYYATFSSNKPVFVEFTANVLTVKVDGTKLKLDTSTFFGKDVTEEVEEGYTVKGTWIPANTGVLLKSYTNNVRIWTYGNKKVNKINNVNFLRPAAEEMQKGYKFYMLAYGDEDLTPQTLGFYYGAEDGAPFEARQGSAYLAVPENVSAKGFCFADDATAIQNVDAEDAANATYNLQGQRVKSSQKGIVIVNGKKVVK